MLVEKVATSGCGVITRTIEQLSKAIPAATTRRTTSFGFDITKLVNAQKYHPADGRWILTVKIPAKRPLSYTKAAVASFTFIMSMTLRT